MAQPHLCKNPTPKLAQPHASQQGFLVCVTKETVHLDGEGTLLLVTLESAQVPR